MSYWPLTIMVGKARNRGSASRRQFKVQKMRTSTWAFERENRAKKKTRGKANMAYWSLPQARLRLAPRMSDGQERKVPKSTFISQSAPKVEESPAPPPTHSPVVTWEELKTLMDEKNRLPRAPV
jgi:hypothetical protein